MASMFFDLRENIFVGKTDIQKIESMVDQFTKDQAAIIKLDFFALYPNNQRRQLIKSDQYSMFLNEDLIYSKKCSSSFEKMSKLEFTKSEIWENFRCNRIKKLPENFFYTEPFIHESNHSFAYLAYLSGNDIFANESWIKQNIMFFHVLELKTIKKSFLDNTYSLLAKLDKTSLMHLEENAKYFVADDLIFIKSKNSFGIYQKSDFEKYIENSPFSIKIKSSEMCFYQYGGICFEKSNIRYLFYFEKMSLVGLIIVLVLLIAVIINFIRKLSFEKEEQENKKHALRVLTHELRTPISNALLLSEQIANKELNPELIDLFLKLEGEIYRLKRLADKSGDFIVSNQERLSFKKTKIEYLEDYFLNIFEELKINEFLLNVEMSSMIADPFWLRVILKNLIENSKKYGRGKITLTAYSRLTEDIIIIEDEGRLEFKSFKDLLGRRDLVVSNQGLGLGLLIVDELIKKLDGSIELNSNPCTQFVIKFKKEAEKNET